MCFPSPPHSLLYKSRLAQLAWKGLRSRETSERWEDYYRSIYAPTSPGWLKSRDALRQIVQLAEQKNAECYVICFPMLYELNDRYPFEEIHRQIGQVVGQAGGRFIDLFPAIKGMDAEALWVYPTDHHPNERVHRVAARALVEIRTADPHFRVRIDRLKREP